MLLWPAEADFRWPERPCNNWLPQNKGAVTLWKVPLRRHSSWHQNAKFCGHSSQKSAISYDWAGRPLPAGYGRLYVVRQMLSVQVQRGNAEMYHRSGLVISREQGLRYDAGFAVPVLMS